MLLIRRSVANCDALAMGLANGVRPTMPIPVTRAKSGAPHHPTSEARLFLSIQVVLFLDDDASHPIGLLWTL